MFFGEGAMSTTSLIGLLGHGIPNLALDPKHLIFSIKGQSPHQFWTVEYLISALAPADSSTTAACSWFSSKDGAVQPSR